MWLSPMLKNWAAHALSGLFSIYRRPRKVMAIRSFNLGLIFDAE